MIKPATRDTVGWMKIDPKFASLGALILLLGFGAGYFLQGNPGNDFENPDLTLSVDSECSLNEAACKTLIAGGAVLKFAIEPRPIPGASLLIFDLHTENIDIQNAVLDLSGVSMNMGRYRFELESDDKGGYRAEGNLPVCVRNQMLWQADIWLTTEKYGLIKVPYIFTAYKY